MKYVKNDFGSMGTLGIWPFDSAKTFTKAQDLAAGKAWIQKIYTTLKPNVTFAQFVTTLRKGSANNPTPLSDAEYDAWLTSKGFAVNLQPETPAKVLTSMARAFAANKNMLPTRESIDSAFLNPNVIKWTYWDAAKITASQTATQAAAIVSDVGTVLETSGSALAFIIKYRIPIILLALGGIGYFAYLNKGEIKSRIKEKTYKKLGLGK
jgi:hypothetical protein